MTLPSLRRTWYSRPRTSPCSSMRRWNSCRTEGSTYTPCEMSDTLSIGSPAELIESVSDISQGVYVDPSVRHEFQRLMEEHGEVRGLEYQVRRKDGSVIWINEHARAVFDSNGKVAYYE